MHMLDVGRTHVLTASAIAGRRSPRRNRHSLCSSNTAQTAT